MFIDLTLEVTPKLTQDAKGNESKANFGHLGTHFDVMNKEFPLSYLERNGVIFDVRGIDEIEVIDLEKIRSGDFVIFYTGFLEKAGYGTKEYFQAHPQLSNNLIEKLLELIVLGFVAVKNIRRWINIVLIIMHLLLKI